MTAKKKQSMRASRFKAHHKVIFSILATLGVVTVWRGIWHLFDALPFLDNPIVSISLAIIVICVAGVYFKWTNFY